VSLETVKTPKPIEVSVDIPLKLDEELENTGIKPEEVIREKKEKVEEEPLRLEEEPEEMDKVVEEMKIGQGPKGLVGAYGSVHPSPTVPAPT
jgi:predicted metal-dependent hydrolase